MPPQDSRGNITAPAEASAQVQENGPAAEVDGISLLLDAASVLDASELSIPSEGDLPPPKRQRLDQAGETPEEHSAATNIGLFALPEQLKGGGNSLRQGVKRRWSSGCEVVNPQFCKRLKADTEQLQMEVEQRCKRKRCGDGEAEEMLPPSQRQKLCRVPLHNDSDATEQRPRGRLVPERPPRRSLLKLSREANVVGQILRYSVGSKAAIRLSHGRLQQPEIKGLYELLKPYLVPRGLQLCYQAAFSNYIHPFVGKPKPTVWREIHNKMGLAIVEREEHRARKASQEIQRRMQEAISTPIGSQEVASPANKLGVIRMPMKLQGRKLGPSRLGNRQPGKPASMKAGREQTGRHPCDN